MRWVKATYIAGALASVAVHVAAFGGLNVMKKPEPGARQVAVMMSSAKKKQKPKPPEPPKPIEAPKEILQHPLAAPKPAPPPVAPPPDPVAAAHPALAAMPDFGISLSGAAGPGGGGIAVPIGGAAAPVAPAAVHKEKVFGAAAERPSAVEGDDCQEAIAKGKPLGFVQPTYTDDARAAGIEGRVFVELTIDATGAVLSSKVVTGLGHGLDESAIAAAKRMTFHAATHCGKAVQSTLVVSMRFVLGE